MVILEIAAVALALVQTVYTAMTYHSSAALSAGNASPAWFRQPLSVMVMLAVTSWALIGWNAYDRRQHLRVDDQALMISWSAAGAPNGIPSYSVTINPAQLHRDQSSDKLLLIARNSIFAVDRLNDRAIDKSQLYDIDDRPQTLAIQGSGVIRFVYDTINPIEMYVVLLPNGASPNDITKIGDVYRLGGRILANVGVGINEGPKPPGSPTSVVPKT